MRRDLRLRRITLGGDDWRGRFPDTHGWAYAQFPYDAAVRHVYTLWENAKCEYECHSMYGVREEVNGVQDCHHCIR